MDAVTTERSRVPKLAITSPAVPQTWDDFCRIYPTYDALVRLFELPAGPYSSIKNSGPWADRKTKDRDLSWLNEIDNRVQAVHLRQFLATPAATREEGLRVFVQRHLGKPDKEHTDRDKIDLLIVQYFVLCAPQNLIDGRVEISEVARTLVPVLGEVAPVSAVWCEPLDQILESAQQSRGLRDFMEQGLVEQGRLAKEAMGPKFYDPAALVSICRFNFLLRRSFIQQLHGDLRAIGSALTQLEGRGLKVVDCRSAGLTAEEPIAKLREIQQRWKPPFQIDYSQDSALRPYEQLMCLLEDLHAALGPEAAGLRPAPRPSSKDLRKKVEAAGKQSGKPAPQNNSKPSSSAPARAPVAARPSAKTTSAAQPAQPKSPQPPIAGENASSIDAKASGAGVSDVENLEEKIWEQLIATPPARGRSMTTVTVDNTRLLMSAWEVAAFVSSSGEDSNELRRVIVARALLSVAIDRRRRVMDFKTLHQALAHTRSEIPRFQERVDQLKRALKTDSAVNLGISLKRLLSLVDEAEQLRKGNATQQEKP